MTSEPVAFARHLRSNATPHERALWNALSRLRPRFTRQLRIDSYVADFARRRARAIVEADGGQHAGSWYDGRRTAALEADGWRVLRVWNCDIDENVEGVVDGIVRAVEERLPMGEVVEFVASRAGRDRRPRTRKKEGPPLAPPARAGGEFRCDSPPRLFGRE